jgi:hypothetical protein
MKLDVAVAKSRLLLPELARILRVPGKIPERDGQTVPCMWPERHSHGDRRPSFNFYAGLTRYRCFGCGAAGDGGDLVAEWLRISPQEGLRRFLEIAGGERIPDGLTSSCTPFRARTAPWCDPWGDSPEKRGKRMTWQRLRRGTPAELATVGRLRGLDVETCRRADRLGWLRFCELSGCQAWVLCSACGRNVQARRLDGRDWDHMGNRFKAWSLPGSCASLPLGMPTIVEDVPFVGLASGGPDFLALLEVAMQEGREADCATLGILGESMKLAAPVVKLCRGRRVRFFAHSDDAGRRSAARWAEQLRAEAATCDAFDFSAFGCNDLNDFVKLKPEARDCEVLPR